MVLFDRSTTAIFVSLLLASTDIHVQASSNFFYSRGAGNISMNLNHKMFGSLNRNFSSTRYLTFSGGAADFDQAEIKQKEDSSLEHTRTEENLRLNNDSEERESNPLTQAGVDDTLVDKKSNDIRGGGEIQKSDSLQPSSISNEPIRISTNRKFGSRHRSINRNQLGKISRKERREQKRKKKLEDKSHRQIAKKLKVGRLTQRLETQIYGALILLCRYLYIIFVITQLNRDSSTEPKQSQHQA